jgi:hypothetical protein
MLEGLLPKQQKRLLFKIPESEAWNDNHGKKN